MDGRGGAMSRASCVRSRGLRQRSSTGFERYTETDTTIWSSSARKSSAKLRYLPGGVRQFAAFPAGAGGAMMASRCAGAALGVSGNTPVQVRADPDS